MGLEKMTSPVCGRASPARPPDLGCPGALYPGPQPTHPPEDWTCQPPKLREPAVRTYVHVSSVSLRVRVCVRTHDGLFLWRTPFSADRASGFPCQRPCGGPRGSPEGVGKSYPFWQGLLAKDGVRRREAMPSAISRTRPTQAVPTRDPNEDSGPCGPHLPSLSIFGARK